MLAFEKVIDGRERTKTARNLIVVFFSLSIPTGLLIGIAVFSVHIWDNPTMRVCSAQCKNSLSSSTQSSPTNSFHKYCEPGDGTDKFCRIWTRCHHSYIWGTWGRLRSWVTVIDELPLVFCCAQISTISDRCQHAHTNSFRRKDFEKIEY